MTSRGLFFSCSKRASRINHEHLWTQGVFSFYTMKGFIICYRNGESYEANPKVYATTDEAKKEKDSIGLSKKALKIIPVGAYLQQNRLVK